MGELKLKVYYTRSVIVQFKCEIASFCVLCFNWLCEVRLCWIFWRM